MNSPTGREDRPAYATACRPGVSEAHAIINRMVMRPIWHKIWVGTSDQQLRRYPTNSLVLPLCPHHGRGVQPNATRHHGPADGMAEFSESQAARGSIAGHGRHASSAATKHPVAGNLQVFSPVNELAGYIGNG